MEGNFASHVQKIKKEDVLTKKDFVKGDSSQSQHKKQRVHKPKTSFSQKGSVKEVSERAKELLADALQKKAESTISIEQVGDEWVVVLEVLEEEYVPGSGLRSMNDIIGVYEVKLRNNALVKWQKKGSRKRGELK
jgi:hypothetical protein